ncbi:MAG: 50S ribosomal protein L17 [Phycisphaerae bacterium]
MRHRVFGKQLSRNTAHRKALRRNMAASLIEHGAIRTTVVKAKELRPFVERLITTARRGTLHARRQVISMLRDRGMVDKEGDWLDKSVVQKLMDEVAPRYADRPGGYTRIIRLSERRIGDAGEQCLLQLVEEKPASAGDQVPASGSRRRRRAAKRHEAAAKPAEGKPEEKPEEAAAESVAETEAQSQEKPATEGEAKAEGPKEEGKKE